MKQSVTKRQTKAEKVVDAFLQGENVASLALSFNCKSTQIEKHVREALKLSATKQNRLAYVAAANRLGITLEEYEQHRASNELWCYRCKTWKPKPEYCKHARRCLECKRMMSREEYKAKTAPRFNRGTS